MTSHASSLKKLQEYVFHLKSRLTQKKEDIALWKEVTLYKSTVTGNLKVEGSL